MSEELKANGYNKSGEKFGEYEFFNIGKTNLTELKKYKIIPNLDYGVYKNTMPDALIVDRRNKKKIEVVAVIEFKNYDKFDSDKKRNEAFEQCNTYIQLLNARFGVATDTKEYYYINPNGKDHNYTDLKDLNRSYSTIKNEDGYDLSVNFPLTTDNNIEVEKSLKIINRIVNSINDKNSQLTQEIRINPKNLAKNVWQSIWLASGENPDKCLSTFIEIFIFRFLSDLGVLSENDSGTAVNFDSVLNTNKNKCLKYYFDNVRNYIKDLFPASNFDNTSIINGFILNPDIKEHNSLFSNILKSFDDFLIDENQNQLKLNNIEPEFKSRIYEDFLKKSISQKNWGQYFTPRSIVKAIIEMSGIENLTDNSVVGDPASGVGGFLLEPLLSKRSSDYYIENTELKSKLIYKGYDRDPKVIILAKANMLIHLSEILADNRTLTEKVANKINESFKSFHSSILGSLTDRSVDEFDLILSNPPYVTKGVTNYKDAIKNNGQLTDYYTINGMGVESFFIEKIINSLKNNGKAFIVIPDGLLNRVHEKKLRAFIKKSCNLNCIVSLPIGTFYSTLKKTYILGLTKKDKNTVQKSGVFSYLISDIGESLDAYRSPIAENNLKDMVRQFKYFMTDPEHYEPMSSRCKIFPIETFDPSSNWCVDKWWLPEEKVELGIEDSLDIVDVNEFKDQTIKTVDKLNDLKTQLESINQDIDKSQGLHEEMTIDSLFNIKQGNSYYTLKMVRENSWQGDIPIFSSNTKENGVLVNIDEQHILEKDKCYDYCLTWAVDGTSAGQLFLRNEENKEGKKTKEFLFTYNNHCGVLIPKEELEFYLNWICLNKHNDYSKTKVKNYLTQMLSHCPNDKHVELITILKSLSGCRKKVDFNIQELVELFLKADFDDPSVKKKILSKLLPMTTCFYSSKIELNLDFIKRNIQPILFQKTRSYRNHKVGTGQITDVEVNIPIDSDGAFDLERMQILTREHSKLDAIRLDMSKALKNLSDLNVVL